MSSSKAHRQSAQLLTGSSSDPTGQPYTYRKGSTMKSVTYASIKTKPSVEPEHLSIEGAANIFAVLLSPAAVSRLSRSKSPR
jgi:hypothetical protein